MLFVVVWMLSHVLGCILIRKLQCRHWNCFDFWNFYVCLYFLNLKFKFWFYSSIFELKVQILILKFNFWCCSSIFELKISNFNDFWKFLIFQISNDRWVQKMIICSCNFNNIHKYAGIQLVFHNLSMNPTVISTCYPLTCIFYDYYEWICLFSSIFHLYFPNDSTLS
jgi:hypothetical protein